MRLLGLAAAALALVAGCGYGGVPAAEAPPVNGDPLPVPVVEQVAAPKSLSIPALRVTDEVVPVGICEKVAQPSCPDGEGEMELPDVTETGWFELAPKPGEVGRAVLASHVDWRGTPGAFKHLPDVKVGDTVTTRDAAGVEVTFTVYMSRKVFKSDYAKVTVPLLFGKSTGRELGLITCAGVVHSGSYDSNWVVLARAAEAT